MNQKVLALRSEIVRIQEKQSSLDRKKEELQRKLQKKCNHEAIYETPYMSYKYFGPSPSQRACIICGETEEEGGCGYQKLTATPIKKVPREEFNELWKLKPLTNTLILAKQKTRKSTS